MKLLVYVAPAHGHVNPMLPTLQELAARGHEVLVHVTREFEPAIRRTGATFRPLPESVQMPGNLATGAAPGLGEPGMKDLMPLVMRFIGEGLNATPEMIAQARTEGAAGVIYDPMALWGQALARVLRLPAAIFQTSFAMGYSPMLKRRMRESIKGVPPLGMVLGLIRLQLTSERLHWSQGLPRMRFPQAFEAVEDLYLAPIPRSYQPDAERFDERFVFTGPSILPRDDVGDFPLDWLDGRPLLYVSLGTTPMNRRPGFYKACFEAFGGTRWQVVMACGKGLEPASLGAVPSNILVRQRVPQLEVLQRARVFISHGGMNSTMESFWHGVPLAVFPQMGDQPINAQRVRELGAGLSLDAHTALDPKVLRDTVERLDTEPGFRARLAGLQKEVREAGGHQRAADVLERYFHERAKPRTA